MSSWTISVVIPVMNPKIYQSIALIVLEPKAFLTPATKEVVADTELGGVWVNSSTRQLSRMGVNGSTPGNILHDVSIVELPSPVLIRKIATPPSCGLSASQQVANKQQSTSPASVQHTQKLDAVVDRKFPDDLDSASIFIKLIGHKTLQHLER